MPKAISIYLRQTIGFRVEDLALSFAWVQGSCTLDGMLGVGPIMLTQVLWWLGFRV